MRRHRVFRLRRTSPSTLQVMRGVAELQDGFAIVPGGGEPDPPTMLRRLVKALSFLSSTSILAPGRRISVGVSRAGCGDLAVRRGIRDRNDRVGESYIGAEAVARAS